MPVNYGRFARIFIINKFLRFIMIIQTKMKIQISKFENSSENILIEKDEV